MNKPGLDLAGPLCGDPADKHQEAWTMSTYRRNITLGGLAVMALLLGVWLRPAWVQETQSPPASTVRSAVSSPVIPPTAPSPLYVDYAVPDTMTLCGESFPLHIQDVYERLDYELTMAVHGPIQVFLWMKRAGRYFPYIQKRLAAEGLPDDLKYLAVAESDLRPLVSSPARATGTWQFMSFTGTRYGLKKDNDFDERLHFERSTEAAIRYLKMLKGMFGKWTLAMAAYNCGEGCVGKEIQEQGVNDYFRLDLPNETERYVYRIAAIKIILQNPEKYGFYMPPVRVYQPLKVDTVQVNLTREVHFTAAAKAIGTDYKVLKELNPEILGRHLPRGSYGIIVPAGLGAKMSAFLNSAAPASGPASETPSPAAPPAAPVSPETPSVKPPPAAATPAAARYYTVRPGDTIFKVSQQTGVPVETIRRLNNIQGNILLVGQKLKLTP
ncbi:MAG: transglycosylase SLT domain-containing protein [Thermodesulfobacteriota bacterium]